MDVGIYCGTKIFHLSSFLLTKLFFVVTLLVFRN